MKARSLIIVVLSLLAVALCSCVGSFVKSRAGQSIYADSRLRLAGVMR